ncbi:MAG: hypothetical protein HC877_09465 [Thioploca sp.]|nr:hypothetical protein [Thioploca sp.]
MSEYLELKYNKIIPICILVASCFILSTSFLVGFSINTLTGLILLPVAILMLANPLVVITANEVHLKNLFGITLKNYSYNKSEISIKNNMLFVKDKKIISFWPLRKDNVDALKSYIEKLAK